METRKTKFILLAAGLLGAVSSVAAGDLVWKGAALAAWTNDWTSIRSFRLTDEGLEAKMSNWRAACVYAKLDAPCALGPEDEIVFRAKATCPETGRLAPSGRILPIYEGKSDCPAFETTEFRWNVDGDWHDYRVRAFDAANGRKLTGVKVRLPPEGRQTGVIVFSGIAIRRSPVPPQFTVMSAEADGFARVGAPVEVRVRVWNRGTSDAKGVKLAVGELPSGVRWTKPPADASLVQRNAATTFRGELVGDAPQTFEIAFTLAADSVEPQLVKVPVRIVSAPQAAKAAYVPEPRPVKTDYEVAACYYPGWQKLEAWRRVERVAPERRPLLGWYDETNPEAVDWQIKWWVEHGITVNMLDWYWNSKKSELVNDKWVGAFRRAKWRRYMKWCVMWCNESQKPGTHSRTDNAAVTRHWIDNYFAMPEYYRIDGKPVVGIFVPEHYVRDLGEDGTRQAFAEMRRLVQEAGYKGLHLIGFTRPGDEVGEANMRHVQSLGLDEVAFYNCREAAFRGERANCLGWDKVLRFNRESWPLLARAGVPFWPIASSGWDDRPWNAGQEVYGRNVADFRALVKDLRAFADSIGRKRVMIGPFNEWGEGSYIEPNRQFGFGMYDAIRDAFCEKPAEGWPANLVPADVGLGPYDFPMGEPDPDASAAMDFRDGKAHGFAPMSGHVKDFRGTSEGLFVSTESSWTPGIVCNYRPFDATQYGKLVVRMKLSGPVTAGAFRLYWKTEGRIWDELSGMSVPLAKDADCHEYVFDLDGRPTWNRDVYAIRLQPSGKPPYSYVISDVRFVK